MPAPHIKAFVEQQKEAGRRVAKRIQCQRCGAECLRGEDHDRSALVATVDLAPIGHLSEMFAIISGRMTYDLTPQRGYVASDTQVLYIREPWHWQHEARRWPVHVEHRCTTLKGELW